MLKKEFSLFLVTGSFTVLIDFLAYHGLLYFFDLSFELSKGISFVTGTLFAYFSNRFWTFSHNNTKRNILPFILLYTATLSINVCINSGVLHLFQKNSLTIQLAFLIATGTSASLNFIGMKFFVFSSLQGRQYKCNFP